MTFTSIIVLLVNTILFWVHYTYKLNSELYNCMKGETPDMWTFIGYAMMGMGFILLVIIVAGGQHAVSNNIIIGG